MQILGWILLISVSLFVMVLTWSCMTILEKSKYMVVLDKQVSTFETLEKAINFIKVENSNISKDYQIYVRENNKYIFVTDVIDL